MNRFLTKVLLIFLSVLIPLIIADFVMSKNYQNRNYYPFTTMTDIVEGRLDSDLWILGSSRALRHYNPRILDSILDVSSYNLGMNAQYLVPELQCYKLAIEYNEKPKYIIMDLMWHSLSMEGSPLSRYFYMPYINKLKVRKVIWRNKIFSPYYLYLPFYRFHTEHKNDFFYENDTIFYKGFHASDRKWDAVDIDGLDTIKFRREIKAINMLNDFLSDCKGNNIAVILVHSPFYYKGYELLHNHDDLIDLFKTIADYNQVPFLDYTKDPISYDTLYFYNNMHLNSRGADLFTLRLVHDIDSLKLIPSRK